jgi:alpha-tubulin suppressor-like RCC1 family protein
MASIGGSVSGNGRTIILLTNGKAMVWGNGAYGQWGNGGRTALTPIPFAVPGRPSVIASGGGTLYLVIAHDLYAIGENGKGQAGIGTPGPSVPALTKVQSGVKSVAATAMDAVSLTTHMNPPPSPASHIPAACIVL